MKQQTSKVW